MSNRKLESKYVDYLYIDIMTLRVIVNISTKPKKKEFVNFAYEVEPPAYYIRKEGQVSEEIQLAFHALVDSLYDDAESELTLNFDGEIEWYASFSVGGRGANWLNEDDYPDFEGRAGRGDAYRSPGNSRQIAHEIVQNYLDPSGDNPYDSD